METPTANSVLMSLACVVAVTVVIKAVNWVWLRPKRLERRLRQQGVPGTSYRLLFGDARDISSMRSQALKEPMSSFSNDYYSRVDPFHHQLSTELGRVYFTWSGPTPVINISKPELIAEVLTRTKAFGKPQQNPIEKKVIPGLINHEGEKWTKHRKILNPAFHAKKLKSMLPAFYDSCAEMIENWEQMVAKTGSGELDVWPHFSALSADVISRAAFGSSYEEGQRMIDLLKEQLAIALPVLQSVYIPGWRYLPTRTSRKIKETEEQIQALLTGIIDKRRKATENGEAIKDDLLGILLDSNSKAIQRGASKDGPQQLGMTLEEVIGECKLFYLAGQETTSVLLTWTVLLLGKHQDWQARARGEVLHAFGSNVPDFEGLSHLKTVTMILYEVLRLYSPSVRLRRKVYKDTKLGDLLVPAGALVSCPSCIIHRSKESWGDDAGEFRPDRFSEGVSKATKGSISFFPFGWGPRTCIGERFAVAEAKMALSMILQRFTFEHSPSYAHAPMGELLLQPQHGVQIILRKI